MKINNFDDLLKIKIEEVERMIGKKPKIIASAQILNDIDKIDPTYTELAD